MPSSRCPKRGYSRAKAIRLRDRIRSMDQRLVRIYQCPRATCGRWHLTSKEQRVTQR